MKDVAKDWEIVAVPTDYLLKEEKHVDMIFGVHENDLSNGISFCKDKNCIMKISRHLLRTAAGAIELSILSKFNGREIAAYDIQTLRCDLYGQEERFQERVMLIYDGLHDNALAMSPFEDAPEEFDQTIFPVNKDRSVGFVVGLALNLVREANRKRSYTNTANFTLRCGVCQAGLVGQNALEDPVSSVRDAVAEALGALLALALNPDAQVKQKGRNYPISAKKLEDGLQKYLILPFRRAKFHQL